MIGHTNFIAVTDHVNSGSGWTVPIPLQEVYRVGAQQALGPNVPIIIFTMRNHRKMSGVVVDIDKVFGYAHTRVDWSSEEVFVEAEVNSLELNRVE